MVKTMKKISILISILFFLTIIGCGDNRVIAGKERKTIGIVNIIVDDDSVMEQKHKDIQYRIIWGNLVWGILLFETVVAPIYFFGFSLFEPIGPKA